MSRILLAHSFDWWLVEIANFFVAGAILKLHEDLLLGFESELAVQSCSFRRALQISGDLFLVASVQDRLDEQGGSAPTLMSGFSPEKGEAW